MIPYGKHSVDATDIEAVVDVLENKFLTQGTTVPAFEQALCDYTGARYCTAVNSGTSGLHVACLALDIKEGDLVWTSPNSFVASANCARYCGATVDFVDINVGSGNICVDKLAQKLAQSESKNNLPKVLIVVHFAGKSCEMSIISELCKRYGIAIIEDAAHGLGGAYSDSNIGSCQFSDLAVLSFHPVKSITTAEGGAVLTNNAELADRVLLFAKHGITRNPHKFETMNGSETGAWFYQQQLLGYNYRLSDLHAALGLNQLTKLDVFISKRRDVAALYFEHLSDLPIGLPERATLSESAWHLFVMRVPANERERIYDEMQNAGIGVNVHYIPIHLQPYYRELGFSEGDFINAETYYSQAISLPIYPELSVEEQMQVISAIRKTLRD